MTPLPAMSIPPIEQRGSLRRQTKTLAPPMTVKEAKRRAHTAPPPAASSPRTMKRLDANQARLEKRREEAAKAKRSQRNKEKRTQQARLLREKQAMAVKAGKIGIEATWGKVSQDQPRLHQFFTLAPALPKALVAPAMNVQRSSPGDGSSTLPPTR